LIDNPESKCIFLPAASKLGYALAQKILDYRLGVHVLAVMKRIAETLSSDANPEPEPWAAANTGTALRLQS